MMCIWVTLPPAVVTGYQQPSLESTSGPTSQFYISLLDASNKEHKLEDRGESVTAFAGGGMAAFTGGGLAC